MRTRLLPLLIVLMAGVLLALGFPLAGSVAAREQQRVVVDRIDDTARFAALAQFVTAGPTGAVGAEGDERLDTLRAELKRYHDLYGIRAGVFYRDQDAPPMAEAPGSWRLPDTGESARAFDEALAGRRSHDPPQVWPWQRGRLTVASPWSATGTWWPSSSPTRPPARCGRGPCTAGWSSARAKAPRCCWPWGPPSG
ncbi:hypothetical protein SANT12839_068540 [Streptomyces antimycoticus]|uniref:Uncharacterized protein n=1 Tax=Streptomyces antimycoticus TaxID=68175 RepID=A0A4D4KCC7_9ACTN|nr:hypothetical protein SANT12839_068540 [Streptomyces antimycoticus]